MLGHPLPQGGVLNPPCTMGYFQIYFSEIIAYMVSVNLFAMNLTVLPKTHVFKLYKLIGLQWSYTTLPFVLMPFQFISGKWVEQRMILISRQRIMMCQIP